MQARLREAIANRLRPIRPPRVVDDVLQKDQLETVLDLIRRHGPWDLILKHHFSSIEELIATMSGGRPPDPDVSLDAFLSPTFRGFFANGGVCLYPEAEPIFYDRRFLAWAREFWGAKYCQPMKILFNVNGPTWNRDPGHLDSPRFRGMGLVNTPTWLLSVMGKSGLFGAWAIKMAEVIAWFQTDEQSGGFTYWPDGPLAAPERLSPPLWNRGVVTQNTAMVHRGESNGPAGQRDNPSGLTFDSTFCGDPSDSDRWQIRTGDDVIARYATDELRLLVHWDAELYADLDDLKKHVDHVDDLAPNRAFEVFIADLRAKGIDFEMPSDPMRDPAFIGLLASTYDVGPSSYPAEAPVAGHAA
ncbi:MAG TPA: hypothetical protein VFY49_04425 [Myxococcota bacterium]|nr:hypothetical protein [Myxococcota bacterium]